MSLRNLDPKHKTLLVVCLIITGMTILAFSAFPLYNLFCRVTGYGGTPKIVDEAGFKEKTANINEDEDVWVTVQFDANTDPDLPWDFYPVQREIRVKVGEQLLAFYESKNNSDQPVKGMATYNVTPDIAGYYFNKIQCFCFDEQTLQPGEKVSMPVSFFVDPEMLIDDETKKVRNITLSYTFFKAKE